MKSSPSWTPTAPLTKAASCLLAAFAVIALAGCSKTSTKSPDVTAGIRTSLNQSGLKDVSVSQDRDKGVITLGGHVAADAQKAQADSIAKSIAPDQVVANQIAVLPAGVASDAKKMDSDVDKGIANNLDAVLIQNRLKDQVKYTVHEGVVTLTGNVISEADRARTQQIAGSVPYVQQVVNELQVKNQKASASK